MSTHIPLAYGIEFYAPSLDDLPLLLAIEEAAHLGGWRQHALAEALQQHQITGAYTQDGDLMGFIVVRSILDEAELLEIVVDTPYQGRGVARALIAHCTQVLHTAAVTSLFLEVRASNHKALHFYQSVGFAEIGRRKAYYPPLHIEHLRTLKEAMEAREDAILMRLDLPNLIDV